METTGSPTGPVTRGQKRYADQEEESRKRFTAPPGYVGPNDVVIEPDVNVKIEIKGEPTPDENEMEGEAAIITIQDQPSVTVKEEIISEDESEDMIQIASTQKADQSQDSNISVGRDLEDQTEEGQLKSPLNEEVASSLISNEALNALQSECNRLGIDISQIPRMTEAFSVEETYRLRLEALVLTKKLENLELRRSQENAENERKIGDLKSKQSQEIASKDVEIQELEARRIQENAEYERRIHDLELKRSQENDASSEKIQKLKNTVQDRETSICNLNIEIKNWEEALGKGEEKDKEIEELKFAITEKDEVIARRNEEIRVLRSTLRTKDTELGTLRVKLRDLEEQVDEAEEEEENAGANNFNEPVRRRGGRTRCQARKSTGGLPPRRLVVYRNDL